MLPLFPSGGPAHLPLPGVVPFSFWPLRCLRSRGCRSFVPLRGLLLLPSHHVTTPTTRCLFRLHTHIPSSTHVSPVTRSPVTSRSPSSPHTRLQFPLDYYVRFPGSLPVVTHDFTVPAFVALTWVHDVHVYYVLSFTWFVCSLYICVTFRGTFAFPFCLVYALLPYTPPHAFTGRALFTILSIHILRPVVDGRLLRSHTLHSHLFTSLIYLPISPDFVD